MNRDRTTPPQDSTPPFTWTLAASPDQRTEVVIVGAGPVGLSLALGLARLGIRSVVLEREAEPSRSSKAPGIHQRTREILRQWGVERRLLERGHLLERIELHAASEPGKVLVSADLSHLREEAERPGLLLIEQSETERVLLAEVEGTGLTEVRFGAEVHRLTRTPTGMSAHYRRAGEAPTSIEGAFIAGCDGASSMVRRAAGIDFSGFTYSLSPVLADVRLATDALDLPSPRILNDGEGLTVGLRLPGGSWRIIHMARGPAPSASSGIHGRVQAVLGRRPYTVEWSSRFRVHRRAAERFVAGRVILAGDAAHIHSPAGGLGMNLGIQDAHNLAWRLHAALRGGDSEHLLDSYDVERRTAIGHDVARHADTLTRVFLQSPAWLRRLAFACLNVALKVPLVRSRALRRIAMLDFSYRDSPSLLPRRRGAGVRLPNVLLTRGEGARVRLYDLLAYEPTLIRVGDARPAGFEVAGVTTLDLASSGLRCESRHLDRLLGSDEGWILVRPDLHIAWLGDDEGELGYALTLLRAPRRAENWRAA